MERTNFISCYIFQGRKYGEYEYRGERYSVCFDWNSEPISWQHRSQQDFIDRRLRLSKVHSTEHAQIGIDLFFNSFDD